MYDQDESSESTQIDNSIFNQLKDSYFDWIRDHPDKVGIGIVLGGVVACIVTFAQEIKNRKDKKQYEKNMMLQKEAICKQNAQIRDLSRKAKKAENLEVMNNMLIEEVKTRSSEGDKADGQR